MGRLRSALLSAYKAFLAITGLLPEGLRSWLDNLATLILLKVANAPDKVIEERLSDALDVLAAEGEADALGDYLEFGVAFGASLACMYRVAQRRGIGQMRLFGFDSFEGLPEAARTDDRGYWSPRMFRSDIRVTKRFLTRAGIDWARVTLVKGWFSDTLNVGLTAKHHLRKASIIMMDCDMYLSAKQALDFCAPLIRDRAIIIFDDWYSGGLDAENLGEKRAFDEFLEDGEFERESLGRYAPNAQVFKVSRRVPSPRRAM